MSQSLKDDYAAFQAFAAEVSIVQPMEMKQGSAAWLSARTGNITASRVADVLALRKDGKPTAERDRYLLELAAERLTGRAEEHYVTDAMAYGIETEPLARAAYEFANDCEVELIGMALHPKINRFSASPDGLVGREGLTEYKCPAAVTHLRYIRAGVIPTDYEPQCRAQLSCMPERKWCDFVSFCPKLPEDLQLFTVRLWRDDEAIRDMEAKVVAFDAEVEALIAELRGNETFGRSKEVEGACSETWPASFMGSTY